MAEEKKPISPPEEEPSTKEDLRPAQQRRRRQSVVLYITILFAAAFALLLMTYAMDQRRNSETIGNLTSSVTDLKEYVSGMRSAQDLYEENIDLLEQIDRLEDRIAALEQDQTALQSELTGTAADKLYLETQLDAMDWFWQINEAFVRGKYSSVRKLIVQMEEAGLDQKLPQASVTDNGRFSPADRYQEIYDAVF